jgi:effector-binding domain-containing protein
MRNMLQKIFFHTIVLMASMTGTAMAVEEAQYQVIRTDAGNRAFRKLFNYISGDNSTADKIAMTAPVTQQKKQSEKIAMTAPVGQRATPDGWAVSFMMPASYTMETIPQPDDPAVVLRHIPEYRAVAIRYSGFWSEKNYAEQLEKLQAWISKNQLETTGPPVWARYNAPFTP